STGFDDADGDTEACEHGRETFHVPFDGEFGRTVRLVERLANDTADARHRDQATVAGAKVGQCLSRNLNDAKEIDVHHATYVLDGFQLGGADVARAGVVDDRVEVAIVGDDPTDYRSDRRRVEDVQSPDVDRGHRRPECVGFVG